MSERVLPAQGETATQLHFARLTALFVGPSASVAALLHIYAGSAASFRATLVVVALLFWLPINPISISSVLAVLSEREEWRVRSIRLAVTWAGILAGVIVGHSYLAQGIAALHSLI